MADYIFSNNYCLGFIIYCEEETPVGISLIQYATYGSLVRDESVINVAEQSMKAFLQLP